MNPHISSVILLLALFWASTLQGGQVLILDDFTDPAAVNVPDRPPMATTSGVGDLGADRTVLIPPFGFTVMQADIDNTVPGQYYVNLDSATDLARIHLVYDFPVTDFTQYEAVILDISSWPEMPADPNLAHVPSLRVVAVEAFPRPFIYWLTRFVSANERRAGRLVLPLDSFTDRAGGPVDAEWSAINQLQLTLGAHGGWGPWEIAIDRITLGPAIPEPHTLGLLLLVALCCVLMLFRYARPNRGRGTRLPAVSPACMGSLTFVLLFASGPTAGAIIVIDDFDESLLVAEVGMPDSSHGVGELEAVRVGDFAGIIQAEPAGRLDVGFETPGVATLTLTSAGRDPLFGDVSVGFHLMYHTFHGEPLHTIDTTEGGRNNAVIVDVLSITGETLPRVARARMIDLGPALHEVYISDLLQTTEPFRLVFPFENFVPRSGITGLPPLDFEAISAIELAFASNYVVTPGQVEQWEIKLDRIWIGPASGVPEPRSIILFAILVVACCTPRILRYVFHGNGGWSHEEQICEGRTLGSA